MKKVLAIMFALVFLLSFAACGKDKDEPTPIVIPQPNAPVVTNAPVDSNAVQDFVNQNRSALVSQMEDAFSASSGMTCSASISAVGTGIAIYININELTNVTAEMKAQFQQAFNGMDGTFDSSFRSMKRALPELTSMTIYVCDAYGDVLATIVAD